MKYLRKIALLMLIVVLASGLLPNEMKTVWAEDIAPNTSENHNRILKDVYLLTSTADTYDMSIALEWDYDEEDDLWDWDFDIYRSTSKNGRYTLLDTISSYRNYYYDDEIKPGISYYYKVVVHGFDDEDQEYYSLGTITGPVCIPLKTPQILSTQSVKGKGIELSWMTDEYIDEYHIYRSDQENGSYTKIGTTTVNVTTKNWETILTYLDTTAKVGKTYYYKIAAVVREGSLTAESPRSGSKSGQLEYTATKITKAVSKKPRTNTITWKKVNDASGYIIYCSKNDQKHYKKLKTIKQNNKCTYTHKKLKNGILYNYKVYAYKNTSYGRIISTANNYEKYCDYYTYEKEPYESKWKRLFGKKGKWYKNNKAARKHMKTISIKVWDKSGKKWFTRRYSITVHKGLAPSVKKMFKEIYKSKSRFPIHDIGCYSWRGAGSSSEHCVGTAFDINANENFMIEGKKILSGSFWKPKKNQYSIPLKCNLVKILKKYGFERGFWGNRKDYMHFSYFGT